MTTSAEPPGEDPTEPPEGDSAERPGQGRAGSPTEKHTGPAKQGPADPAAKDGTEPSGEAPAEGPAEPENERAADAPAEDGTGQAEPDPADSGAGAGAEPAEQDPADNATAPAAEAAAEDTAGPHAADSTEQPEHDPADNATAPAAEAPAEDTAEHPPGPQAEDVAEQAGHDPAEPLVVPAPPQRSYRWLKVLAATTALLVLAVAGGVWYLYQRLDGNITTDTVTETELKVHASERPTEGPTSAENILLLGSDNRGDGNGKYGEDSGTQRSDTAILLHLAADRRTATAMSIPRDLMAHVPSCAKPKGGMTEPKFEQFNWAFQFGGAACTIRTVEDMTGIRIDHHLIVDFSGFKKIVDAIHGVDVCLSEPVHDSKAHLDLPAGRQTLNGEQALGYVRARHGFGDGSDTERMDRQQGFLGSLFSKVSSNGVLLNPGKVYPVLSAATSSLTADPGLDSLSELYGLARDLQRIPSGQLRFLTVPREQYTQDINRDQLVQPEADQLFAALRDDVAVTVTPDGHKDSGKSGTPATGTPTPGSGTPATPVPTYRGTTADADICGKAG
ncbi:LCP family protein [Streptomyces sp. NPDC049040]|uniref:LCP family protein n=1 Tax=Streptomyces sp. NPDC049040 TaxID=3365593 RepID=UPI0037123A03